MPAPKSEVWLWVTIYLAAWAIAAALTLVMSSTAHATNLANKRVILKRDSWTAIRYYAAPNNVGVGTHIESYTITTSTDYLFLPDETAVNKVAPVTVHVCYHRNTGNGSLFQGVNSNPYYMDETDVVNIGAIEVADDNTGDNCNRGDVPLATRRWLRMDQSPLWFVNGKLRIAYTPDQDFTYMWAGVDYKYFHPGDDPNIGDWFYCECDYGGAGH
jgi:hypothetical protein